MKAYKGFPKCSDGKLFADNTEFNIGQKYSIDGYLNPDVGVDYRGFVASKMLCDCWMLYPNNGESVFYEVECGGDYVEAMDIDNKYSLNYFVCSEITLLKEVEISPSVPVFDGAFLYSKEGVNYVWKKGGDKGCLIDTDGNIIGDWFDKLHGKPDNGNIYIIERNGKCEILDLYGKPVQGGVYDDVGDFAEGVALVKRGRECNYIDINGNLLSKEWFIGADAYFFDGVAWVMNKEGKENRIRPDGSFVYDEWVKKGDYIYAYNEDGKMNITKNNGDEPKIFDRWFDEVVYHEGDTCLVKDNGKYNHIDLNRELISDKWWTFAREFQYNGTAFVVDGWKWNRINKKGELANSEWKEIKHQKIEEL